MRDSLTLKGYDEAGDRYEFAYRDTMGDETPISVCGNTLFQVALVAPLLVAFVNAQGEGFNDPVTMIGESVQGDDHPVYRGDGSLVTE
jgi:hypothetical protein